MPEIETILVGGQAVAFWSRHYLNRPVTSQDIDFLGTAEDAEEWSQALGIECKIPDLSDPTPNSAMLRCLIGKDEVDIDFLASLEGLNSIDIRKTAIEIHIGDKTLRIMHPILCLESRVFNQRLPSKKGHPKALEQLEASIDFSHGFLQDLIAGNRMRSAFYGIERVFALVLEPMGKEVWYRYGIDVLRAIPQDSRLGKDFWEKRYPAALKQIEQSREKFRQLQARRLEQKNKNRDDEDQSSGFSPN
ncbi:hypothetical protein [Methylohalobius crimeensis]|uniref:hypothetical protein n=1 Tax=Methylohalobius crimeensis TaxID=244365 RepID=UPI001267C228|nr:hypothetical protein [Methylohalobius crimeensis]